jgi:hypothetical protein
VPQNKDLKRLVRARMTETGENYTQALTALLGETMLDPLPDGWFMRGNSPSQYAAGLLPPVQAHDGGRVMRLRFRAAAPPEGFGTVMQSVDATRYRGSRARFSAVLRAHEVTGWAGVWLRVDTADGTRRAFDNMNDRPLRGSADWTEAANVLDITASGSRRCSSSASVVFPAPNPPLSQMITGTSYPGIPAPLALTTFSHLPLTSPG